MTEYITSLVIPVILSAMGILFVADRGMFDEFIEGAKNGLSVSVKLLPTLILLMVGVGMFTACGCVDFIASAAAGFCASIGIPPEIIPIIVLRPVSGSASLAMASDLFAKYSADSFAGLVISVIMGSSDTLLYISAVYFASVGVKKTRHAVPCAALTMVFCIFVSCAVCRLFFE